MNILIKSIRNYLNLSQEEFAKELGVSFATVNRWENSKVEPNRITQLRLYDFCKEKSIPVCDMLMQRISKEVNNLKEDGKIVLYHGSKSGIVGNIAPISRQKCDFGKGFYMGTEAMQPLTLICDYEKSKFYIVSISMEGLEKIEISVDLEWAMFVAFNRGKMEDIKGTNFFEKYNKLHKNKDILVGNIANDRMFYVLDNFFQGNITDLALIKSLAALKLGKQYVAISEKACDAVKIEKEIPISYLEKRFLQDISEENRITGISIANKICKNYRREGKFFDEILEEEKDK